METSTPQQRARQAEKAYQAQQYAQAADLFEQAAQTFTAQGDVLSAAEMSSNRSVALLQAGDANGAYQAAQGVDRVFALAGDTRRQAMAVGNEAAALEGLNQLQPALLKYQECAELLKQVGDNESRAMVLKSISQIQMRTGHQLEALASMDAALEQHKRLSIKERMLKKLLKVPFQMLNRG